MAERSDYADVQSFVRAVAGGDLKDDAALPVTYEAGKTRPWSVEYLRDGERLGIEIDLLAWVLQKRWTQEGVLGWPPLESPFARQSCTGEISVGDVRLICGSQPAWLFACPETDRYVAAFHGVEPEPLTLTVPEGEVHVEAMGTGIVVWDKGGVTIEAVQCAGVEIAGGRMVSCITVEGA